MCDVYGTTKVVKSYRLVLCEVNPGGNEETDVEVRRYTKDLCARALGRLTKFVQRGLTPPGESA